MSLDALFGRRAPRTLEIGFGNGEHLAALAAAHPERDYFGIEVHRPGVGHLLHARGEDNLTNVRASSHDAVEVLRDQIAPASLDEVLRAVSGSLAQEAPSQAPADPAAVRGADRFAAAPGGVLQAGDRLGAVRAADARGAWARSALFANLSPTGDWIPRPDERAPTRFEKRGARLGHGVWDLALQALMIPSAVRARRASIATRAHECRETEHAEEPQHGVVPGGIRGASAAAVVHIARNDVRDEHAGLLQRRHQSVGGAELPGGHLHRDRRPQHGGHQREADSQQGG